MFKKNIISLAFLLLFASCGNDNEIVNNDENREEQRIISTTPATTDILVELGVSNDIIAVDTYSSSNGLNQDVVVMDFLAPDIEAIIDLNPTMIFYTNYYGGTTNPYEILSSMGVELVELSTSTSIDGIYNDIIFYGEKTNTLDIAEEIVSNMKKEVESIKEISKSIENKKTIYFEVDEFEGRLYSVGYDTYIDDIIEIVGAENIFHEEYSWIVPSEESIVEKNPDIIITGNTYNTNILNEIKSRQALATTTAVKEDEVYLIDGNTISKGTHEIINAIKYMAEIIYPDVYDYE